MRLSPDELDLFTASCSDLTNTHAQELLNVFGVAEARSIFECLPGLPSTLRTDVVSHIRLALTHESQRRAKR